MGEKRWNLQKFSAKMLEKILHFLHFFALIGNTDVHCNLSSITKTYSGQPSNDVRFDCAFNATVCMNAARKLCQLELLKW